MVYTVETQPQLHEQLNTHRVVVAFVNPATDRDTSHVLSVFERWSVYADHHDSLGYVVVPENVLGQPVHAPAVVAFLRGVPTEVWQGYSGIVDFVRGRYPGKSCKNI